jgi:hypothetical protein
LSDTAFWTAFFNAQKSFAVVKKEKTNSYKNYNYASIDEVLSVVMPCLHENDIFLLQPVFSEGDAWYIETRLVHVSGGNYSIRWRFSPDSNIQGLGSQITYLRRYQLVALLGLQLGEDDDGAASVDNKKQNQTNNRKNAKTDMFAYFVKKHGLKPDHLAAYIGVEPKKFGKVEFEKLRTLAQQLEQGSVLAVDIINGN